MSQKSYTPGFLRVLALAGALVGPRPVRGATAHPAELVKLAQEILRRGVE